VKLVRQASLAYQGGTSDKVYEVDLCEVGSDRFVVNFRYGRRGSTLRDGTKTTTPVTRAEAEKVFDRLVASKKAEGYWDAANPPATAPPQASTVGPAPVVPAPAGGEPLPREKWVIEVLSGNKRAGKGGKARAAWRAAELDLRSAEYYLVPLANQGTDLEQYCVAAALGRCHTDTALAALQALATRSLSEMVKRMALEAQRAIVFGKGELAREAWIDKWLGELPPAMTGPARESPAAFSGALKAFLALNDLRTFVVLEKLYLLDTPNVRPALLEAARTLPLRKPHWKALRHVYKMAEYRRDGQLFGILARRIDRAQPTARALRNPMTGEMIPPRERDALSRATRRYLRRRSWRTLRRVGLDGRADEYVQMAAGVLAAMTDQDSEPPREKKPPRYSYWRRDRNETPKPLSLWDGYARYWAFNQVLYGKSPRYTQRSEHFVCKGWKPGDPVPDVREESFPEHWDHAPEGALHLLDESACERVHVFAVKVLRANTSFTSNLDPEALAILLLARYEVTTRFGLALVRGKHPLDAPDEVLAALASSDLEAAREEAWRRIAALEDRVIASTALVAKLIRARHADSRARVRDLLARKPLEKDAARVVMGRLVADLRENPPADEALALDVVKTLGACFARELQTIGREVVNDLLASKSTPLVVLGAEILLARQAAGEHVDGETIARFIKSDVPGLRSVGVRMLGNLPEPVLLENQDVIITLAKTDLADLREAVRPLARAIAAKHPDFAAKLALALIDALVVKRQPEGLHDHLLRILKEDLQAVLPRLPKPLVQRLLHCQVPQAQELGGVLLRTNVRPDELSVKEIVRLASHDVKPVRETAWLFFEQSLERVRRELTTAIAILDARWEDSRTWARQVFAERIPPGDLTPSLLVAICDSVRPDVQAFGKELVTKRFEEAHGHEYLLKLSEHPSAELQLFASNFLETYAKDSPERIKALAPYFLSVLSRVNKGRVAKERALVFLLPEALKSEETARVVAALFARQSVTIAIGDRAHLIEGLLAIKKKFPAIEVPIAVATVEVRDGV
jgi:hypothetical protein